MVVLSPDDVRGLPQDVRRKILEYVLAKGVRPRDLGVSPNLIAMVKKGVRPVSDNLMLIIAKYLSPDEFRALTGEPDMVIVRKGAIRELATPQKTYLVEAILQDSEILAMIRSRLKEIEERDVEIAHTYVVTSRMLKRFEEVLKSRKISRKTYQDHLRYLRRALTDLNFVLSPSRLKTYIAGLMEVSPCIAAHTAKALKIFIKEVVKDRELYDSFKSPRIEEPLYVDDVPTLDEVKAVAKAIEWVPAKTFFAMLAETGLRPGELLKAELSWLDLSNALLMPVKEHSMIRRTKRAYISMFSWRLRDFLRDRYLRVREQDLRVIRVSTANLGEDPGKVEAKLFPYRPKRLREAIYEAMDKALGRRFKLYALRKFFATYMTAKRIPPFFINIWQGKIPPKEYRILQQHYVGVWLEELRKAYDESRLCVLCE